MARDVGEAASHEAFPAMQSLKGEPRHYVVAVVHGPLPHLPFPCYSPPNSSSPLVPRQASLFLLFSLIARPLVHDSTPGGRGRGRKEKAPYLPRFSPIPSGPMTHDSICDNPMRQPRSPVTPFKLFLSFSFSLSSPSAKKNTQQPIIG